jgi:TPR repeat protein
MMRLFAEDGFVQGLPLRRARGAIASLLVVLLMFLAAPASAKGRTLAVLGFIPIGALDRAFVEVLREREQAAAAGEARGWGLRILSAGEMLALAKKSPEWNVESAYDELALGRLAGVDLVLAGMLANEDGRFEVSLRLYDVAAEIQLGHVEFGSASKELLVPDVDKRTRALLRSALQDDRTHAAGETGVMRIGGMVGGDVKASRKPSRTRAAPTDYTLTGAEACAQLFSGYRSCDTVKAEAQREDEQLRACRDGKAESCYRLGLLYEECPPGVSGKKCPDQAKAREFFGTATRQYTEACKQGDAPSCRDLGVMILNFRDEGDVKTVVGRAEAMFDDACSRGDARACCQLADLYMTGGMRSELGAKVDQARAAKLYRIACDKHDLPSCSNLGRMLHRGMGVEVDRPRALSIFLAACQEGDIATCADLGTMYYGGCDVKADFPRAAKLFGKACDAGDRIACLNLDHVRRSMRRRR